MASYLPIITLQVIYIIYSKALAVAMSRHGKVRTVTLTITVAITVGLDI